MPGGNHYGVTRLTVAILDDPVKVDAELGKLDDLEIVWVGHSVDALMDALPVLNPQVLVLQLDRLGPTPITRAQLLAALGEVKLTIVTYTFARGYVLDALRDESIRTTKEPLTPDGLRALVEGVSMVAAPPAPPQDPLAPPPADGAKSADGGPLGHLFLVGSVPKSA